MAVREYRSNVFAMLMEEKRYALQVYNALNGSDIQDEEMIKIQRMENGIVISVRNDASFFIDGYLNIYEHQSTFSANMALRELIYYVEILKPQVMNRDIYGRERIMIPAPHFCVFYNGTEKRQKEEIFYLSDSFEKKSEAPELEVICRMININRDVNPEFLEKCKVLDEYMEFVERVNAQRKQGLDYREAISNAIDSCIADDILGQFMKNRRNEVMEVMTLDYTWERREELIRRDEYNAGLQNGISLGITQGELKKLTEQICRKLSVRKTAEVIASELEEEKSTVQKIVDVAAKYAPDYDIQRIIEEFLTQQS